jgi:hypothetical protein
VSERDGSECKHVEIFNHRNDNNNLHVKWGSLVTMTGGPVESFPGVRPFAGNEFSKGGGEHPNSLRTV